MRLVRDNVLAGKVLFVDGIGRSGKMFISNLVSSFDKVEITRLDNTFDTVPRLYQLEKIDYDTAIFHLRLEADIHLYENSICRCVNFRKDDSSSVFKNPNPSEYIERLHLPDGHEAVRRIQQNEYIFQNIVHDGLTNIQLFLGAFKDNLRFIHCIRNPIDVIHSWHRLGFGHRIANDPREFQLTKEWKDWVIPIDATGWEDEYINANEYERIVGLIYYEYEHNIKGYYELRKDDKDKVYMLKMDKFNKDKFKVSEEIAKFIGTETTIYTNVMLDRRFDPSDRTMHEKEIRSNLSEDYIHMLDRMIDDYE